MARKKRGRPPTIAGRLERFQTLIPRQEKRRLQAEARLAGVPVYRLVQKALEQHWRALPAAVRQGAEIYAAAAAGEPGGEDEPE